MEPSVYEKHLFAGWGDMDFNAHMRNTAFLDKSADVRMMFFAENGFPTAEFMRRSLGPVILKDDLEYFKEVRLLEPIRITLAIAGLSADGSRFVMRNEIWRQEGKLAARVNSFAGWLDLTARRLVAPPEALLAALRSLPQTDDFRVLELRTSNREPGTPNPEPGTQNQEPRTANPEHRPQNREPSTELEHEPRTENGEA